VRHAPSTVSYLVGLYIAAAYWFTASTSFANPAVTIARTLTNTFAGIAPSSAPAFIIAQGVAAVVAFVALGRLFSAEPSSVPENESVIV
jgi:glycerol uptake facilitator-like aquaporin